MWVVAKIKKRELDLFKKELIEKFGTEIKFYSPKIQYQKYFQNKIKKIESDFVLLKSVAISSIALNNVLTVLIRKIRKQM